MDSTWITSAPYMASTCETIGPAQFIVKSATRSPANGSASGFSPWLSALAARGGRSRARTAAVCSPSNGGGPAGRRSAPPDRVSGTSGCVKPERGLLT